MGLAAPRKRVKISHDPNNTTWAQSTGGFGHKIMTSQGWTPGSFLGARNASHSDSFTAASASHIRVTLKDDMLGLGARAPTLGNDDVAAIDAFQGLLGRLNGKSDVQLEDEQRKRDDTRLALYARTKYHAVTFISGGYLVQEKPKEISKSSRKKTHEPSDNENDAKKEPSTDSTESSVNDSVSQAEDLKSTVKTVIAKKSKKNTEMEDMKVKKKKKDIEARKEKSEEKVKDKKERREKKEKKKEKEGKERKKEKKDGSKKRQRTSDSEKDLEGENSDSSTTDTPNNKVPPQKAAFSQAQKPTWRHAIRGRHIQQKRMALLDDRSLGEIFMVKA